MGRMQSIIELSARSRSRSQEQDTGHQLLLPAEVRRICAELGSCQAGKLVTINRPRPGHSSRSYPCNVSISGEEVTGGRVVQCPGDESVLVAVSRVSSSVSGISCISQYHGVTITTPADFTYHCAVWLLCITGYHYIKSIFTFILFSPNKISLTLLPCRSNFFFLTKFLLMFFSFLN